MVQGHEVDDDGLTWTLKLREGLRFHDKEPVLARDVVASIRRFAPRIPFASALIAATDELSATDDRTVRVRLKWPFPQLPLALAGPGGTVPAIMPERLAATSAYQPVTEVVGSGPFRFLKDEHISGARAAFARFELLPRSTIGGHLWIALWRRARLHLRAEGSAFRAGRVVDPGPVLGPRGAQPRRGRLVGITEP